MIGLKRLVHPLSIVILSLLLTAGLVMIPEMSVLATEPAAEMDSAVTPGDGFILRFDPTVTQFQVITLPTVAGRPRRPHSVAVVTNPPIAEIWYTDPGVNKIGRLIYNTITNDYVIEDDLVTLPAGSDPFDLVANDGYIWFTARGGGWIGRLEISTTTLISYSLAPDSAPWSITIGSGDSIWFTEKEAARLGRLIVTDTNNFDLTEYSIPNANSEPQGLAVVPGFNPDLDFVFFSDTAPDQNRLVGLNLGLLPPDNFITAIPLTEPSYPVNLVRKGTDIWFTELLGNNIWEFHRGTLIISRTYTVPTPHSQPYDLLVDLNGNIWFSERLGRNLGQLTTARQFSEYPVPSHLAALWLQGIGLDAHNKIWIAGFVPEFVYLPTIFKGS